MSFILLFNTRSYLKAVFEPLKLIHITSPTTLDELMCYRMQQFHRNPELRKERTIVFRGMLQCFFGRGLIDTRDSRLCSPAACKASYDSRWFNWLLGVQLYTRYALLDVLSCLGAFGPELSPLHSTTNAFQEFSPSPCRHHLTVTSNTSNGNGHSFSRKMRHQSVGQILRDSQASHSWREKTRQLTSFTSGPRTSNPSSAS